MSGSRADQPAKVGARHPDHPAVDGGAAADQDLAVVEQVELAGELALAQHDEHVGRAVVVAIVDLDLALEHEEEVDAALPPLEQQRPRRDPLLDRRRPASRAAISSLSRGKVCASRA